MKDTLMIIKILCGATFLHIFVNMRTGFNIDLSGRNTFRMKVSCRCLVEYENVEELRDALADPSLPRPLFPIGGASNLLFTSDFPGTLLHCGMKNIKRLGPDRVYADAGVVWDDFCAWCASEGLWGPENLSHIPGEVGASAVQNIGAYGREVCELIESVECVDTRDASKITIPASECEYAYRDSRFKHDWKWRYVVTGVVYRVSLEPVPVLDYGHVREAVVERFGTDDPSRLTPAMIRETVTSIRKGKLPEVDELGSAGSFFRNPCVSQESFATVREVALRESLGSVPHFDLEDGSVKIPAAWLIDKCGWKGMSRGGAAVFNKQPLVIVNWTGEAVPEDVMSLAEGIRASVKEKFGVELSREVEYV